MADKGAAGAGRMWGCLATCLMICGPYCLSENVSAFPKVRTVRTALRKLPLLCPFFRVWFVNSRMVFRDGGEEMALWQGEASARTTTPVGKSWGSFPPPLLSNTLSHQRRVCVWQRGCVSPPALKHVIYPRESNRLLPGKALSARRPEAAWLGARRGRRSLALLWPLASRVHQPFTHRRPITITRHCLPCAAATVKSRPLAHGWL